MLTIRQLLYIINPHVKKEENMALKLTRKAGESIILKYLDESALEQNIRILLRKTKRCGGFEIDYYSTVKLKVLSSSGLMQALDSNEHTIITHDAEDHILINAAGGAGYKFVLRFGSDELNGVQLRMWFDAPSNVQILRDELVHVA